MSISHEKQHDKIRWDFIDPMAGKFVRYGGDYEECIAMSELSINLSSL